MQNADSEAQRVEEENTANKVFLYLFFGFVLVFVGIAVIAVASVLYASGSANFGAVIFIGPIPIVIGTGSDAVLMVLFSIVLVVLSLIVLFVMRKRG